MVSDNDSDAVALVGQVPLAALQRKYWRIYEGWRDVRNNRNVHAGVDDLVVGLTPDGLMIQSAADPAASVTVPLGDWQGLQVNIGTATHRFSILNRLAEAGKWAYFLVLLESDSTHEPTREWSHFTVDPSSRPPEFTLPGNLQLKLAQVDESVQDQSAYFEVRTLSGKALGHFERVQKNSEAVIMLRGGALLGLRTGADQGRGTFRATVLV